jgi:DNA-binding PadR family transcriptional regulator
MRQPVPRPSARLLAAGPGDALLPPEIRSDRVTGQIAALPYTQYHSGHAADGRDGAMSIRHALLALLSEGPKYGLRLREEFEERTGEVWPLNVGQVYTNGPDSPQKGFRITEAGQQELATWLRTPPDLSSPPRDELVMKVLVAVRLPGVNVSEMIQAHRRYLIQLMQEWTRIKEEEAETDLGLALVVDAELLRLDSVLRWLDAAETRIRRATPARPAAAPAPLPRLRRRAWAR